jgi:hypothetical protein
MLNLSKAGFELISFAFGKPKMNSSRTSRDSVPLIKHYGTGAYLAGVAVHAEIVASSFIKAVWYWCLPLRCCCPR